MHRPSIDEYFLTIARAISLRGSCPRRQTGCVLVDKYGQVLATGYNGKKAGSVECYITPCAGADAPSGTRLDACMAIHAEANALLQCREVDKIYTAYCTTAPCIHCTKLLNNTGCQRILFIDDYPHSEICYREWVTTDDKPNGRSWFHYPEEVWPYRKSVTTELSPRVPKGCDGECLGCGGDCPNRN